MKKIIPLLVLCAAILVQCTKEKKPFTFSVGSFEVTILNDVTAQLDANILIDATPEMLSKYAANGKFDIAMNAFLVKANGKNILVDSGVGENLVKNLNDLKIDPKQIDIVLLTHMHYDHIGGLLKDGLAVFPNAEVYIARQEHDFWTSAANTAKAPAEIRDNFTMAQNVVKAYSSKLHLFTPVKLGSEQDNLFTGIRGIESFGHTPGHTCYLLESEGEKMMMWGDLAHAMSVQMPNPQVAITFDHDPKQAVIARKAILEYVEKNNIPVAGMHIVPPAMGKISKSAQDGEAYTYKPF